MLHFVLPTRGRCSRRPSRIRSALRSTVLVIALCHAVPHQGSAQNLHEIANRLAPLRPPLRSQILEGDSARFAAECAQADAFLTFLDTLTSERDRQAGLSGSVKGGLTSDDASSRSDEAKSKLTVTSEISLSRGSYPNEVELSSGLSVDVQADPLTSKEPRLRESVSNVFLAYDRYWYPWLESFVFLDRFSDEFLSIEQRYEVGAGFKIILHRGSGLAEAWRGKVEILTRDVSEATRYRTVGSTPDLPTPEVLTDSASWKTCLREVMEAADLSADPVLAFIDSQREELDQARRNAVESIVKEQSRLTVSIAVGAFVDAQQHALHTSGSQLARLQGIEADSLFTATRVTADSLFSRTLPTRRAYNWELRPTVQWNPYEKLRFRADLYLKYPIEETPTYVLPAVDGGDAEMGGQRDFRTDFRSTLTWLGADGVEMSLSYRRLGENRPPWIAISGFVEGLDGILWANQVHHILKMQFGVTF